MVKHLLILLLLFIPSFTLAGDFFDDEPSGKSTGNKLSFELNGFTRGVFFGGKTVDTNDLEIKAGYGELGLKCRARIGQFGDGYAELRFRGGSEFGSALKEFNLREAYVNAYLGNLSIRLGHQIVVWGRADGINPTNNITPQNMAARSVDEDDRKNGNFLLRSTFLLGPINFELVWVPKYVPSLLPTNLFSLPDEIELGAAELPDASIKNCSYALKTGAVLGSFDCSASWFRGYMPMPGLVFSHGYADSSTKPMKLITVINQKSYVMNVFGADFSTSVGSFGLRGEFAYRNPVDDYTLYDKYHSYIPNPDFQYVLGVDKSIGNFSVIVQYVGRYVVDFDSTLMGFSADRQLDSTNRIITSQQNLISHSLFVRPNLALFHETCHLEVLGYYNITTKELLFRPSMSCDLADALTLKAGWEGYSGPEGTLFGNIKDALSSVFVELKASF